MQIDDAFLEEVGLKDLSASERPAMLQHIRESLEVRLGQSLSKNIPDALLVEFFTHIKAGQSEQALAWLRKNIPNYSQIVKAELASLKKEIRANAAQILKQAEIPISSSEADDKSH